MTAIHLRLEHHMSVLLPPPRHCINNVSSDTAEPGGAGDGDNLLRDLKGTPATGDKGFGRVNEGDTSFTCVRRDSGGPGTPPIPLPRL